MMGVEVPVLHLQCFWFDGSHLLTSSAVEAQRASGDACLSNPSEHFRTSPEVSAEKVALLITTAAL